MEHTLSRSHSTPTINAPTLAEMLRIRNFRLLWLGEGVSVLGDHFSLIAMPWLVLQLTGDSLVMGTVIVLQTIPRTLFMLLGGALTDRFSPRAIMFASNFIRMLMITALAGLVWMGAVQLWMLYLYALMFGLVGAFFYPANSAMLPRLLKNEMLEAGNSLVMSTAMIGMVVGPALAGGLIALFNGGGVTGLQGIALAFALDAVSFLASLIALALMRFEETAGEVKLNEAVLTSIVSGLRYLWNDPTLRLVYFIAALANFLTAGPVAIGLPVLANTQFAGGAAAYGAFMSASGLGMMLGAMLAGILPKPKPERLGATLVAAYGAQGMGVAVLPLLTSTVAASALMLIFGAMSGYVMIVFTAWFQRRTPATLMGRMMSLLNMALIGLTPVSTALAGVLSVFGVGVLMTGAGVAMAVIVMALAFSPRLRAMGLEKT